MSLSEEKIQSLDRAMTKMLAELDSALEGEPGHEGLRVMVSGVTMLVIAGKFSVLNQIVEFSRPLMREAHGKVRKELIKDDLNKSRN